MPEIYSRVVKGNRTYYRDMAERAVSTFWQGAVGVLAVSEPTTNWAQLKQIGIAAAVAGIASVASLAKAHVVRYRGIQNSASASSIV